MLNSQINQSQSVLNLLLVHKPFLAGGATNHSSSAAYSPTILHHRPTTTNKSNATRTSRPTLKAIFTRSLAAPKSTKVHGSITTKSPLHDMLKPSRIIDDVYDLIHWPSLFLEFVSNDLDSRGQLKKKNTSAIYHFSGGQYDFQFEIPEDFGEIGAVLVDNQYKNEIFLESIILNYHNSSVSFTCNSWLHTNKEDSQKRIFFSNKCYLPSETPEGLKSLRDKDLCSLRGTGKEFGERQPFERIYDYDVYNDLGAPDKSSDLARPVLGGMEHPYPRRCRTGRSMSSKDPLTETRSLLFYVPIDENFSEIKGINFGARTIDGVLHSIIPKLDSALTGDDDFPLFNDVDLLYHEGVTLPDTDHRNLSYLYRFIKEAAGKADALIKFEAPAALTKDVFFWLSDEEFCRQMLAGINPCSINLVTEWPLMSKLDPEVYGPAESAITKEIVEKEIKGVMTFEEALAEKKLFMLDYHDLLLPFVNKVREVQGTTLYGSRTLMFLTPAGTLTPVAIELTVPPSAGKPQWKHVYTPSGDATDVWLWKFAKAHVLAHDSGYHQLVSHWIRTHCVTEPYIIATNRHLSQMHPIARLLHPHFRYTMQINSLARRSLINAGGVIESTFSPRQYSMQLSSHAYDKLWRFDREALPADLISRGMGVKDPTAPHGIKLTIEDYPFANDGLLLWDSIKQWATSYVNHYYPQAALVESDIELQAWWNEIRTVGHGDKKDEKWWPELKTQDDLIGIVSTMIWVTAGHHSAVNFGQYDFAGYFPNRPSIARTKMPNEDATEEEWKSFIENPDQALLKCFPSKIQATKVMLVLDVLSSHSKDEEYIGETIEGSWDAEPAIKNAHNEFKAQLKKMDEIIESRNKDRNLKNRTGAGLVPYQLLKPSSEPGVTGKGVPNSISI